MDEETYLLLVVYLLVINLVGFMSMAIDKRRARRRQWRIPESTLLIIAFIGGAFGSFLGMQILRHKTKHLKFLLLIPLALIIHILIGLRFV
ncbi:MAG: DUF1294 domain-containing protein [Clostridiales bacterium]|nr:DUF1294 domain-containing protein [Clostridiales bacterium]